jgi:hypothetical protein
MAEKAIRYCVLYVVLFTTTAGAQQQWLHGFIKDSSTAFPVGYATVTNSNSKKTATADGSGFFSILAAPNDVLYIQAKGYRYDTLQYAFLFADSITIFLSPAETFLPNVTITSKQNQYQIDSIERRTTFEQMRGDPLNTVAKQHEGFGLTINLDRLFKKKYSNKKRQEKMFEKSEEMAYINYRFSPRLVAYYTGLKAEALREFMYRYTPSAQWLRHHPTNTEVVYYINEKLKAHKSSLHR